MPVRRVLAVGVLAITAACGGGTGPENGTLSFTVSPIPIGTGVKLIIPRGNLNPPDHTLPTDHEYFYTIDYFHCPCSAPAPIPVVAPGAGTVTFINQRATDAKVSFQISSTVSYYLDHVVLDAGITVGHGVQAGDRVGTTNPNGAALDLGVVNSAVTHPGLLAQARYPDQTLHSDGPLQYFTQPLRDQLIAIVKRNGADYDGKLDFDQVGKLVGNWFLQGVPNNTTSVEVQNGPKQLAFVYDVIEPTQVRIAIGGTVDIVGVWAIAAGDPAPVTITPASGAVVLHLQYTGVATDYGRLLVQMLDAATVKVEKFPVGTGALAFDAGAQTYVR